MKKQILTLAIIAAVAGNISAQNLATEITVDRTVVPVEQAAGAPRAFHPVLIRPSAPAYRMPLTDYSRTSECTDTLPALPPAVFNGMTFPTHYRGYASAGYFPALNFGAEAGYRLIDRSTTRLDAWGSWQGRSYTSRRVPAADGKETGRIADQSVQLAASLSRATGRNSLLSASFTYRHDALRLPTAFDRDASQAINAYRGEIGWSTRRGHASLDASISAGRTALHSPIAVPTLLNASGKADGAAEADYRLSVEGNILRNRDIGASLLVDADILHRQRGLQWADDFTEAAAPGHSAATIVGITPNATFNSRNLRGHIGLRLDFSHGYNGHSFRIAPDINIGWTPTATFGIYLRADGGSRHRSLASLAAICPFAPGATVASRSTSAVDARAGLTAGPFAGFSAEIYGGYASVHGAHQGQIRKRMVIGRVPLEPAVHENQLSVRKLQKSPLAVSRIAGRWRQLRSDDTEILIPHSVYHTLSPYERFSSLRMLFFIMNAFLHYECFSSFRSLMMNRSGVPRNPKVSRIWFSIYLV